MALEAPALTPPALTPRASSSLLPNGEGILPVAPDTTTAITLENVNQLQPVGLHSSGSSQESDASLLELLHDLVTYDVGARELGLALSFNLFTNDSTPLDEAFLLSRVVPDKLPDHFSHKLKHFFILSSAGKPIYSLNGGDDEVSGYMGLITTIVSAFEQSFGQLRSVRHGGFQLAVLNRPPLIYVAVLRIPYELAHLLERQLGALQNHLLAILSKPSIVKHFKRENYDLRRMLTPQDMHALDSLSMRLTYGFSFPNADFQLAPAQYVLAVLGGLLRCARITHKARAKLESILVAAKKLKVDLEEGERPLAQDLLFALIVSDDELVAQMRPKNHILLNEDILTLLHATGEEPQGLDLWVPLCMPRFNSSGFLYTYVLRFEANAKFRLLLTSASKDSFYHMKATAKYITDRIHTSKTLKTLTIDRSTKEVLKELHAPLIRHYIYHRKNVRQFYMDNLELELDESVETLKAHLHITYLYAQLKQAQTTNDGKKLTHTRWLLKDGCVTGFMLSNPDSELYCLCSGPIQAQDIIGQSSRVMKWCERYRKRLCAGEGVSF